MNHADRITGGTHSRARGLIEVANDRSTGRRTPPGDSASEGFVAARRRGAFEPRVQGLGARRVRAGRAGDLGAAAPAPGRDLRGAGRPAAAARVRGRDQPRRGLGYLARHVRPASRSTSCACTSSTTPTRRSLDRFASSIQLERQDFNGRMLTIRRSDLRVLASCMGRSLEELGARLEQLGLRAAVGLSPVLRVREPGPIRPGPSRYPERDLGSAPNDQSRPGRGGLDPGPGQPPHGGPARASATSCCAWSKPRSP